VSADAHILERAACRSCFACVEACPTTALQVKGRSVTVDEIVARAIRMKPFFDNSGGGITLTGGEVTMQSAFAAAVLERCHAEGIQRPSRRAGCVAKPCSHA
jgi:pyruvate formate lyase activating enzyme